MAARKVSTSSLTTYTKKEKTFASGSVLNAVPLSASSNASSRSVAQSNEADREPLIANQIRSSIEQLIMLNGNRSALKVKERITAYRNVSSRLLQLSQSAPDVLSSKEKYAILHERGVVTTLQSVINCASDGPVSLNIVRTMTELVGLSKSKRRVHCLVRRGVTDTLIRLVMDASRAAIWEEELMLASHNLLVIVGRRDKKLALKVRLSGLLNVTMKLLKRYSGNPLQAKTLLQMVKLTLVSNQNSAALGKQESSSSTLCKILLTCHRSHTVLCKLALDVLSAVVRSSKQNAIKAVRDDSVRVVLDVIVKGCRLPLNATVKQRDSVRAVRLAALHCLRTLTQVELGRLYFVECAGLSHLYSVCIRDVMVRQDDELSQCAVAILSRCLPLLPLPVDSPRHPVSVCVTDDSSNPNNSADSSEPRWPSPQTNRRGTDSDELDAGDDRSCDTGSTPSNRTTQTQSHNQVQTGKERRKVAAGMSNKTTGKFSARNRPQSGVNAGCLSGEHCESADYGAEDANVAMEIDADEQTPPVGDERDWQSLQQYTVLFPERESQFPLVDYEEYPDVSCEQVSSSMDRVQRSQLYAQLNHAFTHPIMPQLHSKLAYPDLVGHSYTTPAMPVWQAADYGLFGFREPLHEVAPRVQRRRILEDVARFVEAQKPLNNVVYDLDALLQNGPRSAQYVYTVPQSGVNATATVTVNGASGETVQHFPTAQALQNDDEHSVLTGEFWRDGSVPAPSCKRDCATLQFESRFESGNLRRAIQVRDCEYDLVLSSDLGSNRPQQWFYFAVSNIRPNVKYRFNLLNFEKDRNLFATGMKPLIFSVQEALRGHASWIRSGSQVCYYRNCYRKFSSAQCPNPQESADAASSTLAGRYFTLSFVLSFKHRNDVVYIAYHYPYTYTSLRVNLCDWRLRAMALNRAVEEEQRIFYREQTLCETLGGHRVPLLTITSSTSASDVAEDDCVNDNVNVNAQEAYALQQLLESVANCEEPNAELLLGNSPAARKQYVLITSRVHPSESNASWMLQGIVDYLLSDCSVARALRHRFVFKIVPMLNPDGVVNGNTRFSLTAEDLNRRWTRPSPVQHSSVYHAKGLLHYMRSAGFPAFLYCDLHGHARQRSVFLYGCDPLCSWLKDDYKFVTHRNGPRQLRAMKAFPKFLHDRCSAFNFVNSCFKIQRAKESTARIVVWRQLGVLRSYTLEASFSGGDRTPHLGAHFTTADFELVGVKFCDALFDLISSRADDSQFVDRAGDLVDLLRSASASINVNDVLSNSVMPYEPPLPLTRQLLLRKTASYAKLRVTSPTALERDRTYTAPACQLPPLTATKESECGLTKRLSALSLEASSSFANDEFELAARNDKDREDLSASADSDDENAKDSDEDDNSLTDADADADLDANDAQDESADLNPPSVNFLLDDDDENEQDGYDQLDRQVTVPK